MSVSVLPRVQILHLDGSICHSFHRVYVGLVFDMDEAIALVLIRNRGSCLLWFPCMLTHVSAHSISSSQIPEPPSFAPCSSAAFSWAVVLRPLLPSSSFTLHSQGIGGHVSNERLTDETP